MALSDERRKTSISELIEFLNWEDDELKLLDHIPPAAEDKKDAKFTLYYDFVQLIDLFTHASGDEKCAILRDIIEVNKHFQIDIPQMSYYESVCFGNP